MLYITQPVVYIRMAGSEYIMICRNSTMPKICRQSLAAEYMPPLSDMTLHSIDRSVGSYMRK